MFDEPYMALINAMIDNYLLNNCVEEAVRLKWLRKSELEGAI